MSCMLAELSFYDSRLLAMSWRSTLLSLSLYVTLLFSFEPRPSEPRSSFSCSSATKLNEFIICYFKISCWLTLLSASSALFDWVFWLCSLRSSENLLVGWLMLFCAACCCRYFFDCCFDFGRVITAPEAVTILSGIVGCWCMWPMVAAPCIEPRLTKLLPWPFYYIGSISFKCADNV